MKALLNTMKLHAAMLQSDRMMTRVGTVSSYDAPNYCVKVTLQPEGVTTGWLPLLSAWVGNGWGMYAPPTLGDLAEVHYIEGDASEGVASLRFFNDSERPLNVPSGEFWLVHASGAFFKLTNDGKASFSDAHGASVALNGDGTISSAGTWTHTGDMTATGNISDQSGIKGTLQHIRDVYDGHVHPNVQSGASSTGATPQTL